MTSDIPSARALPLRTPAPRDRRAAAGQWRDLAWTAGSFALVLALLLGLAPGQQDGRSERPSDPARVAAVADAS